MPKVVELNLARLPVPTSAEFCNWDWKMCTDRPGWSGTKRTSWISRAKSVFLPNARQMVSKQGSWSSAMIRKWLRPVFLGASNIKTWWMSLSRCFWRMAVQFQEVHKFQVKMQPPTNDKRSHLEYFYLRATNAAWKTRDASACFGLCLQAFRLRKNYLNTSIFKTWI